MGAALLQNTVKIDVEQLAIGMFVVELDRPWTDTPFLFQMFTITHGEQIDVLRKYCRYVWVEKRFNIPESRGGGCFYSGPAISRVGLQDGVKHADPIWSAAREASIRIISSIRIGEEIDTDGVKLVVKRCVETILEDSGAMLWLSRIKNSDEYTAEHSLRVAILSIVLGRELGMKQEQLEELGVCGMLHDVGKIKVPIEVLNKPGALSSQEMAIMKSHPVLGRNMLIGYGSRIPPSAVDVAFTHHERLNGQGYPKGLRAESISFYSKIVAVADTYDAISSDRVYSKGRSTHEAMRILYSESNSCFDAEVVYAFIRAIGIYPTGEIVELNTGEVAIVIGGSSRNKLKPRVLIVLDRGKVPCREVVMDMDLQPKADSGEMYKLIRSFPGGSFGINVSSYLERGVFDPW